MEAGEFPSTMRSIVNTTSLTMAPLCSFGKWRNKHTHTYIYNSLLNSTNKYGESLCSKYCAVHTWAWPPVLAQWWMTLPVCPESLSPQPQHRRASSFWEVHTENKEPYNERIHRKQLYNVYCMDTSELCMQTQEATPLR